MDLINQVHFLFVNTCGNCGHNNSTHKTKTGKCKGKIGNAGQTCNCKHFKPSTSIPLFQKGKIEQ